MRGIPTITLTTLLLSSYSFANTPYPEQGAAAVDEKHMDEIKTKKSAIERQDPDSSINSQMYDQEDHQDRGAEKAMESQEERERNKKGQD